MMIVLSIYTIVDGIFITHFTNSSAFAAVNLIFPPIMIVASIGFMLGTGGSALIAKKLGEGKIDEAKSNFSFLTLLITIFGIVLGIILAIIIKPLGYLLGATEDMIEYCVIYATPLSLALPFFMLQNLFQAFFPIAEKNRLGLIVTLSAGIANIVLDAILIVGLNLGVLGASIGTLSAQFMAAIIPIIIFFNKKRSVKLHFTKPKFDFNFIKHSTSNGFSEFVSNIAMNVVAICFNYQLLKMVGEDGINAYGIILYITMIFVMVFIGYNIATCPIISFNLGSGNYDELKNVYKKSIKIIVVMGIILCALSEALSYPLSMMFVGYDLELCLFTQRAFMIYMISYLVCGFNIFGSALFTALNNGLLSALISSIRTFVFQIGTVFLLPLIFDVDGIWISPLIAEILTLFITFIFISKNKKRYHLN